MVIPTLGYGRRALEPESVREGHRGRPERCGCVPIQNCRLLLQGKGRRQQGEQRIPQRRDQALTGRTKAALGQSIAKDTPRKVVGPAYMSATRMRLRLCRLMLDSLMLRPSGWAVAGSNHRYYLASWHGAGEVVLGVWDSTVERARHARQEQRWNKSLKTYYGTCFTLLYFTLLYIGPSRADMLIMELV